MASKLALQLMDARMVGDEKLIAKLQAESDQKTRKVQIDTSITPMRVNNVLNNEDSKSIDMYHFINNALGEDWWEWEIETIDRILWIKYGFVLDGSNRDKILAMRHLSNSNLAFSDWYEFNQVAIALSGGALSFEVVVSPTPGMILSAMKLMQVIRPDEEFEKEVRKYISILLITDGIYTPPPTVVEIIGEEFNRLISVESASRRNDVYMKYRDILTEKKYRPSETVEDIQARRLMKAEKSAATY